ncbi:hypothetical protein [Sulfurimonas sp.]|uniref:hypothetical protein n=1 Tax=Sulfurimonas sp. TaxID=2022749 RepID=UPI002617FA71|nr:hypothetical protein [Sulfurimonas sp.]MDD5156839.1 hypothetical protein [Sulfurimonas sp.]
MLKEKRESFILNKEHLGMFLDDIRDDIINYSEEALELEFNPSEYYAFERIINLIHDNTPENKDNFIKKAYQKVQKKVYNLNQKDPDQDGKTPFEKGIVTATKNQYKRVNMGIIEPNEYNNKSILIRSYINLNADTNNQKANYAAAHYFRKKYRPIVKEAMKKLRNKYHTFKNTIPAQEFKQNMDTGIFKDKIDYERLFKYVSCFDIKPTKETFELLKGIVYILCLKHNPSLVPEHYKKSLGIIGKEFIPINKDSEEDIKAKEALLELMEDMELTPEEFEKLRKSMSDEL